MATITLTIRGTPVTIDDGPRAGRDDRDMQPLSGPVTYGGGDLNGSQATHLLGQAGTGCGKINVPRKPASLSPNYCGVV